MRVGRQRRGIVERADANKAQLGTAAVIAPQGRLADGAAMDVMRAAAVGGHGDDLEIAAPLLDAIGLDQRVDHEGASRLALAIMTVTAMDEHRLRGEPI